MGTEPGLVPGLHIMVPREGYDYPLPVRRPASSGEKFIYIDYVNDEPFYVGMGNWNCVRNPDRNNYHMRMLYNLDRKDRWIRRAVARNLNNDDAFNLEHTLILCYGRKDIGTGILVNRNNGIGIDLRNLLTPTLSAPESRPWAAYVIVGLFFSSGLAIVLVTPFLHEGQAKPLSLPTVTSAETPASA